MMKTLNELKLYIEKKFPGEPDMECQNFLRSVCLAENWVCTEDSELNCYYDPRVYVVDGKQQLAYYDKTGWTVGNIEEVEIDKGNIFVTVREDIANYYIDLNTGLGEGIYSKADWSFIDALKDQMNIQ